MKINYRQIYLRFWNVSVSDDWLCSECLFYGQMHLNDLYMRSEIL